MSNIGIKRLLQISLPVSSLAPSEGDLRQLRDFGKLGLQIADLAVATNGFYALESALHFFACSATDEPSIFAWNSHMLWRSAYGDRVKDLFFFAENIFGEQFCLLDNTICTFDPETGEVKKCCCDLEEWADLMLGDEGNYLTGYSIGHQWQLVNGPLAQGRRLVPKMPFVCQGPYEIGNLFTLDAVQGMLYRAEIAQKVAKVPNGSEISFYTF